MYRHRFKSGMEDIYECI